MKILVIGQTSMEMYRMEFGNIGNYYILEPLFRNLHKTFPDATISTTLQLSDRFCKEENVIRLPLSLYYDLNGGNKEQVEREIEIAKDYQKSGILEETTPYLKEVSESDLIMDFSGDIWGENANLLNADRFYIGVCKVYIAHLMGKFTTLFASSPGPFDRNDHFDFAKMVFKNFDFVANREAESKAILSNYGFDTSRVESYVCPAFQFEGKQPEVELIKKYINRGGRKTVGFILTGFNFLQGPHNKWPREEEEYVNFVQLIEYIIREKEANVVLMSHSNGFKMPPDPFVQIHGSDFKHAKMLYDILMNKGYKDNIKLVEEILSPWHTKGLIGQFDVLISGRIHGAVAGFSQSIPTIVIDYGHEPIAHKTKGFVNIVGTTNFFVHPSNLSSMIKSVDNCFTGLENERGRLNEIMPKVKGTVNISFQDLKNNFTKRH
ncbi:MAG: polysaccharide pyruvyl transferase family protein [Brumimicrobium sp.]|nr:polysaccharide pyruvyl transferase family protein [Brumimicrobium sp.]